MTAEPKKTKITKTKLILTPSLTKTPILQPAGISCTEMVRSPFKFQIIQKSHINMRDRCNKPAWQAYVRDWMFTWRNASGPQHKAKEFC